MKYSHYFAVVLLGSLFFPQLLLADNAQSSPQPQPATFTFSPYINFNVSAGYDSGINLGTVNNHLNDKNLRENYNWDTYIGFDASKPIQSLKDWDFKFLCGAHYLAAKPIGKVTREGFESDKLKPLALKSLYFGLETPYGKVKLGSLATNTGLSPNFWSTGGAANLTIYSRTFFPVTNAIRYESPNFDGLSLHLVKGLAQRITGIYQRYDLEGAAITATTEPVNTYGGTLQYQDSKSGSFIKYTGLIRQDGLLNKESKTKHNAYLHSVEGGLNSGNLSLLLGYQYLHNNAGWGDTVAYMSDDQIEKYVGCHPEIYGKQTDYGVKYFAFPMHEVALSASYRMGKITPKFSVAYGAKAKNEYSVKDKPESEYHLPGYIQCVAGIDYALSNNVFLTLAYGTLKWQHEANTPKADQWFDQKSVKLYLSYWYY